MTDKWNQAVLSLSQDEQGLLRDLGSHAGVNGVAVALDMSVRHGLSEALGEMGQAVQALLVLLGTHDVTLPAKAMPLYDDLLRSIAGAASQGAGLVRRSQELDQAALLALATEPCRLAQ